MREKSSIAPRLPENGKGTEGGLGTRAEPKIIGLLEHLRRKVEESRDETKSVTAADLHRRAAPVAAAVLDGYGKDESAAACIGETKQKISDMRAGLRGMSLWQLVRLLDESDGAFIEFCRPFCERHSMQLPQREQRVTREQIIEAFMRSLLESPPLLRLMVGDASRAFGVSTDEVLGALGGK